MKRRSATTSLIIDASNALQETVGVFFNPEWGAAIFVSGNTLPGGNPKEEQGR